MKTQALLILAVNLMVAADAPKEGAAKKDEAIYNLTEDLGMWSVVSWELAGERQGDVEGRLILGFRGDKIDTNIVAKDAKEKDEAEVTFKLDPSKTPGAIDLTPNGDLLFYKLHTPKRGMTFEGIYAVDKGTLKICLAPPTEKRPADFSSKPNRLLLVLKPALPNPR